MGSEYSILLRGERIQVKKTVVFFRVNVYVENTSIAINTFFLQLLINSMSLSY